MEKKMEMILKDLYRIDPGLRSKEAILKKTIEQLLANKPDAEMNSQFANELRDKLLRQFSAREVRKRAFLLTLIANKTFQRSLGGLVAICLVVVIAVQNRQLFVKPTGTVTQQLAQHEVQANKLKGASQNIATKAPASPKTDSKELRTEDKDYLLAQPAEPEAPKPSAIARAASVEKAKKAEGPGLYSTRDSKSMMDEEAAPQSIAAGKPAPAPAAVPSNRYNQDFNTEGYNRIEENSFFEAAKDPLSTLSIDVDTASYANVRRFINEGQLPYPDAVRIEEMINYFSYDYNEPTNSDPLAFNTELSSCPWNQKHQLLRVGLQAKRIDVEQLPPNNLVFLLDVSGSMEEPNKLPLVKEAMKLLVQQMRPEDKISIAVYAGNAGLVLPATSGSHKKQIVQAIDNLEAGGSTAGGEGIILAYETAKKAFIRNGNNRVIIATDGDFNVGASSDGELVRMIEERRNQGIFLSVLGFGEGNYKDSKMQQLADKGNGNYAYIDTLFEAKKVLVNQMAGTLLTIAKDVKIQIEFNPAVVKEYRLIGYEKRVLAARDFDDDKKDAGELGAGHSVTALYEIIPADGIGSSRELKYQKANLTKEALTKQEILTIKFRYKKPDGNKSKLLTYPVKYEPLELKKTSDNFRFAASVAEWGLLLRNSEFKGNANFKQVIDMAKGARGKDPEGYRKEFIDLVKASEELSKK